MKSNSQWIIKNQFDKIKFENRIQVRKDQFKRKRIKSDVSAKHAIQIKTKREEYLERIYKLEIMKEKRKSKKVL